MDSKIRTYLLINLWSSGSFVQHFWSSNEMSASFVRASYKRPEFKTKSVNDIFCFKPLKVAFSLDVLELTKLNLSKYKYSVS